MSFWSLSVFWFEINARVNFFIQEAQNAVEGRKFSIIGHILNTLKFFSNRGWAN